MANGHIEQMQLAGSQLAAGLITTDQYVQMVQAAVETYQEQVQDLQM